MNAAFLLDNTAAKFPQRMALISERHRLTYQELWERSARRSGAMLASGLKRGDRVAILAYNSIFFVETYFAAVKAGLAAVLINTRLAPPEMAYIINNAQPSALFYGPEFEAAVREIKNELETITRFVSPQADRLAMAQDDQAFLSQSDQKPSTVDMAENEPCLFAYTSGTTGLPKGAVITHGNMVWNFFNTIMAREDLQGEKLLMIGPLFHAGPLNNQLNIQIGLGGTCILRRSFDPEEALRTIQEERVTALVAVPTAYNLMIQHPRADQYDIRSVLHVSSGADKLPMETRNNIPAFFKNVKGVGNGYGCTEATAIVSLLNPGESQKKGESVGRPTPLMQVAVVDDEERPLPAGRIGEVICKGPTIMKGYHRNPEATKEILRRGWLQTGDLGYLDDDGYLYIVDRKKDMIISGGENIYPREVEEVLFNHPEIADAAVTGAPDSLWGEAVKAFIVKRPGSILDAEAVIEYCKSRLAGYKKPKAVEFIDEIPRGGSGKALKHLLRKGNGSLKAPSP